MTSWRENKQPFEMAPHTETILLLFVAGVVVGNAFSRYLCFRMIMFHTLSAIHIDLANKNRTERAQKKHVEILYMAEMSIAKPLLWTATVNKLRCM